jgi:hypothetical protein
MPRNNQELKVLRQFVAEFNPFYAPMVNELGYTELTGIVKEIAEEF